MCTLIKAVNAALEQLAHGFSFYTASVKLVKAKTRLSPNVFPLHYIRFHLVCIRTQEAVISVCSSDVQSPATFGSHLTRLYSLRTLPQ